MKGTTWERWEASMKLESKPLLRIDGRPFSRCPPCKVQKVSSPKRIVKKMKYFLQGPPKTISLQKRHSDAFRGFHPWSASTRSWIGCAASHTQHSIRSKSSWKNIAAKNENVKHFYGTFYCILCSVVSTAFVPWLFWCFHGFLQVLWEVELMDFLVWVLMV